MDEWCTIRQDSVLQPYLSIRLFIVLFRSFSLSCSCSSRFDRISCRSVRVVAILFVFMFVFVVAVLFVVLLPMIRRIPSVSLSCRTVRFIAILFVFVFFSIQPYLSIHLSIVSSSEESKRERMNVSSRFYRLQCWVKAQHKMVEVVPFLSSWI